VKDLIRIKRRHFLVMPFALAACNFRDGILRLSGLTMGTTYNVIAVDNDGKTSEADLQSAVETGLARVNSQMSNWNAGSEISRFNAQGTGTARLSDDLATVVQAAQDVHMASNGMFDVTVGRLVDLWGFGAGTTGNAIPADTAIAEAMEGTGQSRNLRLSGNALEKLDDSTEIYLSSIGKGYGVDVVAAAVESFGITDYMVEIGGDLYTSGNNPDGQPWQIGIEAPFAGSREVHQVASVSGFGLATSGDYRNFFEQGGVRYSHIIDPTTGYPITHNTVSATVLTDNAMLADAWATAMLTLGRDRGMEIAEARNMAVVFIENDGNALGTSASSRFAALQA
jgi:thiamine biosynthesis lipoprotein